MMSQLDQGAASSGHHFGSPDSPAGTPDSFNYETKFIVLNFMSRNPHKSITSPRSVNGGTPLTSTSDSDHHLHGRKSASKSMPPSPPKRHKPRLTDFKRVYQRMSEDNINYKYERHKTFNNDMGTAGNDYQMRARVSEDNINHRHNKSHASLEEDSSLESSSFSLRKHTKHYQQMSVANNVNHDDKSAQGNSGVDAGLTHESANGLDRETPLSRSSMSPAQYRQYTMSKMGSEISGDYSYTSDADDEGEDTSGGSSLWGSAGGLSGLRGSVDLHQVLSRLPTVQSESDMENETVIDSTAICSTLDGASNVFETEVQSNDNSQLDVRTRSACNLSDIDLEIDYGDLDSTYENDPALSTSISLEASSSNTSGIKSLDRSKLWLDIQVSQSWPNSQSKAARYEAVAASLRSEIEDEMTSLESEVEEAIKQHIIPSSHSPFMTPMTPQTQAAKVLARIGDEVMDQYEEQLDKSVAALMQYSQHLTYDTFCDGAKGVLDHDLPEMKQVALLMVYGQKAAWRLVESGHQGIGNLVDYTSRLVADHAAEFIIKHGGWGAVVSSSDSSLSSDSLDDVSPLHTFEDVSIASPVDNSISHMNFDPGDISAVDQPLANGLLDTSVNNNSYSGNQRLITAELPQIPAGHVDPSDSSSDEADQQDHPIVPWYHWFIIPEHVAMLSCTVAAIGLGLLLSNAR